MRINMANGGENKNFGKKPGIRGGGG